MSIRNYICNSANLLKESDSPKNWSYSTVDVKDELPDSVSLSDALNIVSNLLPDEFLKDIQSIEINNSKKLKNRGVDAILEDGATIVITNEQKSEEDLVKDIVHEVGHLVERQYADKIYSDDQMKKEFLSKRRALFGRLNTHGYDVSKDKMLSTKYDETLDNFFWKTVGYSELAQHGHDLFLSPYAATSLREYWSDGFEDYFLKGPRKVKKYSPTIHQKISTLLA